MKYGKSDPLTLTKKNQQHIWLDAELLEIF